ncbi:MAG: winged-helix domain-containing protein [bacterium]|nr:winged-helix domain-containing protein [bacterium]
MDRLSDRKNALLSAIIEQYVATARPIGSKMLAENHDFDISSATIRNEMKELEDLGMITHPHTSAGRIPTEKGYRYYVEHFVNKQAKLAKKVAQAFDDFAQQADHVVREVQIKYMAKELAELTSEAVLVRFGAHSFYYTGISNIFRKPEFSDTEMIYSLSELVDHFDDVLEMLGVTEGIDILIGKDNPISKMCSTLVTEYGAEDNSGVIAILGPMRMNYQQNYGLLKHVKNLITN